MSSTRRELLLAGCSALPDPGPAPLVAVNNHTGSRHRGQVLVEPEGREVVNQYIDECLILACSDAFPSNEAVDGGTDRA